MKEYYVVVRHKVKDYDAWKELFDEHAPVRKEHGFKGGAVLRSLDDPNELILWSKVDDLDKLRAFFDSESLKEAMKKGGVIDKPDVWITEEAAPVAV